jgi:hypothetical protein
MIKSLLINKALFIQLINTTNEQVIDSSELKCDGKKVAT